MEHHKDNTIYIKISEKYKIKLFHFIFKKNFI